MRRSVPNQRCAFTLIELVVVVIITAVLGSLALTKYQDTIERTYERDGINQLKVLQSAINNYHTQSHGSYWPNGTTNPGCGAASVGVSSINQNLRTNILENEMTYTCQCANESVPGAGYVCLAERSDSSFTLQIDQSRTEPCCTDTSCPSVAECS